MSDDDIANADGIKQGDTESQTMEFWWQQFIVIWSHLNNQQQQK
jgi:hypothetical protein